MVKIFTTLPLMVETIEEGMKGKVFVNDNLYEDRASDLAALKDKMKLRVYAFEGIRVDEFEISSEKHEA